MTTYATDASHEDPVPPPASADVHRVRKPLSWRAEIGRQLRRRRTMWAFGLLLALPVAIIAAFKIGGSPGGAGVPTGSRLVDLATGGSANFAVFITSTASSLLMVVLTALFAGDPVPSEASWSTLRYLLVAPVSRSRLLTSKLVVALGCTVLTILLLAGWSLLTGGLSYGWAPLTNPAGGVLTWSEFAPRMALAVGYLIVFMLQVVGIAFWLGVRTDAPLAAVGGTVMMTIVASILDQIDRLGSWRNALPLHYDRAWLDAFSPDIDWTQMLHGSLWSLVYFVLFTALAYWSFERKDILS